MRPYGYYNLDLLYATRCARCRTGLPKGERAWYSQSLGQTLCATCYPVEFPNGKVKLTPEDLDAGDVHYAEKAKLVEVAPSRSMARRLAAEHALPTPTFEKKE